MSALPLSVSLAFADAAMLGRLAWLDSGSGQVTMEVYGGDLPGAGITGGTLLAIATMTKPCGSVADGVFTMTDSNVAGATILANGEARWARFKSASGAWAFDLRATIKGGDGGVQIEGSSVGPNGGAMLYAGGKLPPVSLRFV